MARKCTQPDSPGLKGEMSLQTRESAVLLNTDQDVGSRGLISGKSGRFFWDILFTLVGQESAVASAFEILLTTGPVASL